MKTLTYSDGLLVCGDNLEWMRQQPDNSIDLIFGSPPYEDRRTYGIDFDLQGQAWVDWMVERWQEMDRICRGLVAMVLEGSTDDFRWSATPALLMADLHRAGFKLRKPPIYRRGGIPGSGGPEWLKNCYEFIICTTKGRLPWAEPTACGHPPKFPPGGRLSHQTRDGRVNKPRLAERRPNGERVVREYKPPKLANPGNIIDCGQVGGGHMGSALSTDNEAPFPEWVPDFFIRSFCQVGGTVLDPFSGSGTTIASARKNRRRFIGIDIRQGQVDLSAKRLEEAALKKGFDI